MNFALRLRSTLVSFVFAASVLLGFGAQGAMAATPRPAVHHHGRHAVVRKSHPRAAGSRAARDHGPIAYADGSLPVGPHHRRILAHAD